MNPALPLQRQIKGRGLEEYFEDGMPDLPPRKGRLVALRTVAETQTGLRTTEAYTIEIPLKAAHGVLRYGLDLPLGVW